MDLESLLRKGLYLKETRINTPEYALTKLQALSVIKKLEELSYVILGGDVYHMDGKDIQVSYDNWFCDPIPSESINEYIKRSHKKTLNYIDNYQAPLNKEALFVLVYCEKQSLIKESDIIRLEQY